MKIFDVFSWDNGYASDNFVVGGSKEERLVFPSVTYQPNSKNSIFNITNGSMGFIRDRMILQHEGDEYFIGDYAIEQDGEAGDRKLVKDKFKQKTELIKLLAGAALLAPGEEVIKIKKLMVGLTIGTYRKYKDEIVNQYENKTFRYKVPTLENGSREVILDIEEVICIPQGVGAFYDLLLDFKGQPANGELLQTRYGLIDIGGKTVDAFISQGDNPIRDSVTALSKGTSDSFKQVGEELDNAPYNLIEKAYLSGREEVFWSGNYHQITEKCKDSLRNLAHDIYNEVEVKWARQIDRVEFILVCGGGAEALTKYLKELFSVKVDKVSNPQFANANGYFKLGVYSSNGN